MTILGNKTIIVCSIVRNAAHGLKKNIPVINRICSHFKDYIIIIYENDSTDSTKDLLSAWAKELSSNVYVDMKNFDNQPSIPTIQNGVNPFFSRKRITKMAFLRNQYMTFIQSSPINYDYVMVVDLDVAKIDEKAVLSSFNTDIPWDAVTAFGYSIGPNLRRRYHDTYALTLLGEENEPQTESKIKEHANSMMKINNWFRVFSAFGGLAIYKFEAIKDLKYQVYPNNDDRVEVKCEHYSIYKQMKANGYDNVYINPDMVLKYQDLSWTIIWNSIKRKLNII